MDFPILSLDDVLGLNHIRQIILGIQLTDSPGHPAIFTEGIL